VASRSRLTRDVRRPPAALAALAFGTLARVRGDRALHPRGVVFAGTVATGGSALTNGSSLFARRATYRALIRISRGAGLPDALPDVRGCAVRILDSHGDGKHQDLLLASSFARPGGRHLLVPGRDFGGAFYSSVLPYRVAGRLLLFGAAPADPLGRTLDDVEQAVSHGGRKLRLFAATPLGNWQELAVVDVERTAPDDQDVRFNPWVTGGGIRPAGTWMGLRDPAYRASQAASNGL
jgi:hypothetical protein